MSILTSDTLTDEIANQWQWQPGHSRSGTRGLTDGAGAIRIPLHGSCDAG